MAKMERTLPMPDLTPDLHPEVEDEVCSLTIGRADSAVKPCRLGQGLWTIYALHKPPGAGKLANRLVVYKIAPHQADPGGQPELAIVNGITPDLERDEPFAALRNLAFEQGAPVRHIFNPGPEHHVSLPHYARVFPDAKIYVAGGRIQRENPKLCALPSVEVMAPGNACPDLAARGFHVHVWDGLMEGKTGNWAQFRFGAKRGIAEPTLFFHESSQTLLNGGHAWWYWGKDSFIPWPARKMFKMKRGEVVWSPKHYSVFDKARCAASAAQVLRWSFDELLDLHVPLNDHLRSGAYAAVEKLCKPMAEGRWSDLPLKHESLQIPEGTVTGGGWKSY